MLPAHLIHVSKAVEATNAVMQTTVIERPKSFRMMVLASNVHLIPLQMIPIMSVMELLDLPNHLVKQVVVSEF